MTMNHIQLKRKIGENFNFQLLLRLHFIQEGVMYPIPNVIPDIENS